MAMSQEHGSTLQEVQQLMKKNQVRQSNQPTYSIKVTDTNYKHVYFVIYFFLTCLMLSPANFYSSFYCQVIVLHLSECKTYNSLSFYRSF